MFTPVQNSSWCTWKSRGGLKGELGTKMSRREPKTYMDSEERKDFLLESGFLLMSASASQTDKVEQMGQGRRIHSFQTKTLL